MKRIMKKALACTLAAATAVVFLCACGGKTPSGGDKDEKMFSFKQLTAADGDLLVFGRGETLSTAQAFFGESVQGLFAQKGQSKYWHYQSGSYEVWLEDISTGYNKNTRDVTLDEMAEDYFKAFGKDYVLYDGGRDESVNCARSIAGVKQVAMIDLSLRDWAESKGMTQKYDATQTTAKEVFDAYKDEFDRTGLVQQKGSLIQLTDYAIACRYFCYFETSMKPAALTFRNEVQDWCRECAVYGWCPVDEGTDVDFSSRYGSFTLASDYCYNMSVLSCKNLFGKEAFTQPNAPAAQRQYPLDKHYVTIVNSDGDNLQCWYGGTFKQAKYMGAERGDFPFGWSVSPALYSLAPLILSDTYQNAQAGDRFVCSVTGLGYTYPMSYGDEELKRYCATVDDYLGKTDLSVVKILDNGLPERTIEAFSKMEHAKGFLYCTYKESYAGDHGSVRWSQNGKPFVACRATMWNSSPQAIAEQINAYPADAKSIAGYTYVNLHVWSMDYDQVKEMVELLNPDVEVVDPDTFLELITKNVPHEDVQLDA